MMTIKGKNSWLVTTLMLRRSSSMVKRRKMFLFLKISPSVLCPLQMHGGFFYYFALKMTVPAKLRFVATVTTGGRVKFVPAV